MSKIGFNKDDKKGKTDPSTLAKAAAACMQKMAELGRKDRDKVIRAMRELNKGDDD